jgi:hypothetical protein
MVFPWLVLEKVKVWDLYAISSGIGLGGAPDEDELVVHENVVVAVEVLDELAAAELDVEVAEDALIEAVEDSIAEELEVLIAELTEVDVEALLLSARYAAVPPTASTTITTTAMTA